MSDNTDNHLSKRELQRAYRQRGRDLSEARADLARAIKSRDLLDDHYQEALKDMSAGYLNEIKGLVQRAEAAELSLQRARDASDAIDLIRDRRDRIVSRLKAAGVVAYSTATGRIAITDVSVDDWVNVVKQITLATADLEKPAEMFRDLPVKSNSPAAADRAAEVFGALLHNAASDNPKAMELVKKATGGEHA